MKFLARVFILFLAQVVFLSFALSQVLATATLYWSTKASIPSALRGIGATTVEGKIYTFGGTPDGSTGTITIREYSPISNSWTVKQASLNFGQFYSAVVVENNQAYIVGGHGRPVDLERYDPFTDSVARLADIPGGGHSFHGAAVVNNKIYAIGGAPTNNAVNEYDIATDTWRSRTNMPTSRQALGVSAVNGKIYAIGGMGSSGPLSVVEEYDPSTDTWISRSSMPTARYQISAVALSNGKIYVVGGVDANYQIVNTVEEYDPVTDTWITVQNMPTTRYGVGLAAAAARFYAVGGGIDMGGSLMTNVVEEAALNQPPIVDADGPYNANEGGSVQVNATGNDPENGPLTYAWDLDNNGSFETPGQNVPFSAAGLDGPTSKTIAVQVTDNGNLTATDQTTVNVLNVAATIGAITAPSTPIQVNTAIAASASFTDPGVLDTHTAFWNWGDGSITPGTVTESNGSGFVSDSHTYTAAGVYTITLTVTDKDGGTSTQTFQYISVYNPTPQGLFIGNRIFSSPAGAYPQNPNLTGQVQFGVTSKYQDTSLIGKVSMNFRAANLEFDSISITTLVTSNEQATLRGTGTINGSGNYNFLVTGLDSSQDTIRFQIKDQSGTVIYDSQPGAVDTATPTASVTGQVIIH